MLSDPAGAGELLPLVYDELRRLAGRQMAGEAKGHTLSPTALVHEAYARMAGPGEEARYRDRAHFYHAAAMAMRRVLVDHARAKGAAKRGGPEARRAAATLEGLPDLASEEQAAGFLILDELISRLEVVDPDGAAVVRLRFFGGLSVEQTALVIGVSEPTVKRSWAFARAWLKDAIERA